MLRPAGHVATDKLQEVFYDQQHKTGSLGTSDNYRVPVQEMNGVVWKCQRELESPT